jgi:hypothetical protein
VRSEPRIQTGHRIAGFTIGLALAALLHLTPVAADWKCDDSLGVSCVTPGAEQGRQDWRLHVWSPEDLDAALHRHGRPTYIWTMPGQATCEAAALKAMNLHSGWNAHCFAFSHEDTL